MSEMDLVASDYSIGDIVVNKRHVGLRDFKAQVVEIDESRDSSICVKIITLDGSKYRGTNHWLEPHRMSIVEHGTPNIMTFVGGELVNV